MHTRSSFSLPRSVSFVTVSFILATTSVAAPTVFLGLTTEEYQPTLPWSGRVDAVAIDPKNAFHVLAATESGGLFQSRDGGITWRHVDTLPAMNTRDVLFVPTGPAGWILVTAAADFQNMTAVGPAGMLTTTNGGIWISRDGGTSWSHPDNAVPLANGTPVFPEECPPDHSAYGAAYDVDTGGAFVATDCGISLSDPNGSSWLHIFMGAGLNASNRTFHTVAALDGPGVILAGRSGAWYSPDAGLTWRREETGIGLVFDTHAAAGVRGRTGHAYIVASDTSGRRTLWRTRNVGRTWTPVNSAPSNGADSGCGGIAFIRAFVNSRSPFGGSFDHLFYGNTCETYYHRYSGSSLLGIWNRQASSHGDTRAIAFRLNTAIPMYLASDGGLDRASTVSATPNWVPIGSGPGKINALQLYDVAGQAVRGTSEYRLAIGTQDNDMWASANDGVTWENDQRDRFEGGNIQMRRVLSPGETDKWTYVACTACVRKTSDPLFRNIERWAGYTSRPGCEFGATDKVSDLSAYNGVYVHGVYPILDATGNTTCDVSNLVFDMTSTYGDFYLRLWDAPEGRELRPFPIASPRAIYHGVWVGQYTTSATNIIDGQVTVQDTELARNPSWVPTSIPVEYPAMNSFGSLGHYGFQFQWPAIFAVNPHDPRHLIAPDVQNDKLMVTFNGGEDWEEIPGLAETLLTGRHLSFSLSRAPYFDYDFSLISAIEFFPENPELVILGLQQGGAYISGDRGQTWGFVPGSDRINNITKFHWKSANEIYVASYGRGLWRIRYALAIDTGDLVTALAGAESDSGFVNNLVFGDNLAFFPVSFGQGRDIGDPVPLMQALTKDQLIDSIAIAVDGRIMSRKKGRKRGRTFFDRWQLSAGASLLIFAPQEKVVADNPQNVLAFELVLGEANAAVLQDDVVVPPNDGKVMPIGLGFKHSKFVGIIAGSGVTYNPPSEEPVEFPPSVPNSPPSFDRGYITLNPSSSGLSGSTAYLADELLHVRGHAFASASPVDILIDGQTVVKSIMPDHKGEFASVIPLNGLAVGPHQLFVNQPLTEDVDYRTVVITPGDEDEEEE